MHGVKVTSRAPDIRRARKADLTWIQRELVPGVPSWEPWAGRPSVLDVDDAIWLSPPAGRWMARTVGRAVDVVVAGNRYLAEHFDFAPRVEVVPTAVDTEIYRPATPVRSGPELTIGWIGTASNLPYLQRWEAALAEVLSRYSEVGLTVVSSAPPRFERVPPDRVRFVPWSPQVEVPSLQSFDIGLMPLADDEWTRGKCSFKMLQYMACGVAVVASPVGMNAEVLAQGSVGYGVQDEEVAEALISLIQDPDERLRCGQSGRAVVEEGYSSARVAARLAQIFRDLV